MWTRPLAVALLWVAAVSLGPGTGAASRLPAAAERAIDGVSLEELRAHVEHLAGDALEGRGLGQPGNQLAEAYAAGALQRAGVAPAGGRFLHPVGIYVPSLGPAPHLRITGIDPSIELTPGPDFLPLPPSSSPEVTAPLVFAGHGISSPRWRHDDYRRVEAEGAIVLVLEDSPAWLQQTPGLTEAEKADARSLERKIVDARRHRAAGLLVIREDVGPQNATWPDAAVTGAPAYRLLADVTEFPLAVAAISAEAAGPLRSALRRGQTLTARLRPDVRMTMVSANNVLGMVDGLDPRAGTVVVGAHLDHDGVDDAGRIYNGADDNASGTAAVLAIAAAFARAEAAGERTERPVVFALWNGEEKGSLGATAFVRAPVPVRPVAAMINLDMVGRSEHVPDPGDSRLQGFARTDARDNVNTVHLLGYSYSPDLARIVNRAGEAGRLRIRQEYDRGAQGLLRRSDHWPFLQGGIPAVFLTTGLHPDYHTPEDDADRIDFAKLERIAELAARAAWLAATGPAPRLARPR